jgi:Glycoside hydrolase family 44
MNRLRCSATAAVLLTACNAAVSSPPRTGTLSPPAAADATIAVDTTQARRAISPFVYGYNAGSASTAPPGTTWLRIGGNRWTAYNWTSNYSNAGSDYGPYHSDALMGSPADGAGYAAATAIDDAKAHGLGLLVTIPMQGWAAKDASGNVSPTSPLTDHFAQNQARKGSAFTTAPSPTSDPVYQDEFAAFAGGRWGTGGTPIQFALDNEPDLWTATHAEVQRVPLTYAALMSQSLSAAEAIKDAVPSATIFGPVSFGWSGYVNLQNAPDASQYGDFLQYYLDQMSAASSAQGRRLLDVLDLHFYSEARGCGLRVNDNSAGNGDCVTAARVQATRSYWDASYKESSWITGCCTSGGGIRLIGRMLDKIAAHYPDTRLAITEYNGGGSDDISGAVTQADTLGIFGREGVFAASYWPLQGDNSWAFAAWRAFRGYDGEVRNFGDTSVSATTTDVQHVAAYASIDSAAPDRVVIVLVHRPGALVDSSGAVTGSDGTQARQVKLQVAHPRALTLARGWQLGAGAAPAWQSLTLPAVSANTITVTLPPLTVTTIELTP